MGEVLTEQELDLFVKLAELGVTGDDYARSLCVELLDIDFACRGRWGKTANEVASDCLRGQPVRALTQLVAHSKVDTRAAVLMVELAKEARQSAPLRSLETRDEFVAKQRAALGLKAV